jgi:bacterioferritin (cytochrome b1)
MIKEDLIAERKAVEFYSAIIRWLGDSDLTTRKIMQGHFGCGSAACRRSCFWGG